LGQFIRLPLEPLVSVIVPVYNGSRYLADCLNSLLTQTYETLEILIIDDGSTDDSSSIVQNTQDPRIKLVRQNNAGRCAARNVGLRLATGDFIKYVDQDDLIDKDNIRLQVEDLRGEREDVLSCGKLKTFHEDVASSTDLDFFTDFVRICDPVEFYSVLGSNAVQTSVWLTPRPLHLSGGYWNEDLLENPMDDGELFMRILMRSRAVKYCEDSIVYHRLSSENRGSDHNNPTKIQSYFRSLELCSEHLLAHENSARTREVCARWFKHCSYLHFDSELEFGERALVKLSELGYPRVRYHVGGRLFRLLDRLLGPRNALLTRRYAKKLLHR
jgi:glycosyltransferase involved in cell wall biosynthesis